MKKQQVLIFSVDQQKPKIDKINRRITFHFFTYFNKGIKPVIGCYKGKKEISFIVNIKEEKNVRLLCRKQHQESYLYVSSDRHAWLRFLDGREEYLGELKNVNRFQAEAKTSYTRDVLFNEYYVTQGA